MVDSDGLTMLAVESGAIIDNGTIQLGIHPEGHLDVDGGSPSSGYGSTVVGLRYMPTNADALSPGCYCEGWGAADATSGVTGYADRDWGPPFNMAVVNFTSTASTATSVVAISNTLRVTHDYHPSATASLYEVVVSIQNVSGAPVDARYRRVMDWDVEPTFFNEFVTANTGGSAALLYNNNDGFATPDPLGSRTSGLVSPIVTGNFADVGPYDHGALFDFGFGTLAPGETKTFSLYYGAAGTEQDAVAALSAVGAEAYSLGQPNTPAGPTLGTPNTFIFGFKATVEMPPPKFTFGECKPFRACTSDPVDTATGNYIYRHTDISIPGRGGGLVFARAYNSLDDRDGPLGPGWTHGYNARIVDSSPTIEVIQWNGRTDRYTQSGTTYTPPPGVFDTLGKPDLPDATWVLTRTDYSRLGFDAAGKLKYIEDRNGNRATMTYDGSGKLASVSDPAGRGSLTFGYDANGKLGTVTDWQSPPRQVRFEYDANGRLWKFWDRENQPTTFAYDGTTSRLKTITDAKGHVAVENDYDPATGRVRWQRDAKGQQTDLTYGATLTPTVQTLPATSLDPAYRPLTEHYYDAQGRITTVVDKPTATEVYTTQYTYDGAWNRASATDPNGNTTNFCYDGRGNLTRRVDPAPGPGDPRPAGHFEYQGFELTKGVSPKGVSIANPTDCGAAPTLDPDGLYATVYAYDANHNLIRTEGRYKEPGDPAVKVAVAKLEYTDPANPGLVTKIIPPRGNTGPSPDYSYAITSTYGATGIKAGLLLTVTDALGNVTGYDYDAAGRRIKMVDPNGNAAGGVPADHTWEYVYGNEDRLRFSKTPPPQPGGSQLATELRYDAVGNREVAIDVNGQVTRYAYDERDSLAQVLESPLTWTDPAVLPGMVITTEYQYDNPGNLSRVTRAKGDTYERAVDYLYDGLNRLRREIQYPSWPVTTTTLLTEYTHDGSGNRRTLRDPLGQTTTFGYDALNRLISITYSDGTTPNVAYTYDADGNRTSMADGTGSTTYAYDELSRPVTVTSPGPKAVGYRYDRDGNRTKLIYPDGTAVSYTFDKASRLQSLLDWASRATSYQYAPDGSLKAITNFNGTGAEYGYDNARRLLDVWNKQGTNTISRHSYTLDAAGNRTGLGEVLPRLGPPGAGNGGTALSAWGRNGDGELGDGTTTRRATPVRMSGLNGAVATAEGLYHSLAARDDGTVWAWGDNYYGAVGDGSYTDRALPVKVGGLTGISATGAGGFHSLAVKGDGTVWAWGQNNNGQLGDGTTITRTVPVQVSGLTGVSAVGGGYDFSLALKADGTVWGWGGNFYGQLGDGTNTTRTTPVQVSSLTGVAAIAVGRYHSLALKSDGTLWAWGWNADGQLGDGTTTNRNIPVQVSGLSGFSGVAAGGHHSLALKGDGTLWAWGDNFYGQLGDGTNTDRSTPAAVGSLAGVVAVRAGRYYSLALSGDGTAWAWGDNQYSQLGDGTTTPRNTPVQVSGLTAVTGIMAGGYHGRAMVAANVSVSTTNGYDRLYRLTNVTAPSGTSAYSYDPAGNRLSMTRSSTTTYTYDRADRIQQAGSVTYTVNANGNLVARSADTLGYDQANRLKSATIGGGASSYAYSGDGVRASKTVSGTTTSYVYDVNRSLPVVLDDGGRKYVWGLGLAYSVGTTGTVEVYYTDGLGSARAIANANAQVVQTYQTDEFGVPTQTQGSSTQPFQYTGEQRDGENGFYYLRARMYDPAVGRLLSRDPFAGMAATPLSLNRYTYVGNNPTNAIDPSGLSSSRAASDNECLTTLGGKLPAYGVAISCLSINGVAVALVQVQTPFGPVIMIITSPMPAPNGGGGDAGGDDAPRQPSTAFGRAVASLRAYLSTGEGAWRLTSAHAEPATSPVYPSATSVEEVYNNQLTGGRIVRHIITGDGNILHETFRPYAKFGQ